MSGKVLLKLLEKAGWTIDRISGSHHIMKRDGQTIVVPVHGNADLKPGILNSILKKAGLQ